MARVRGPRVPDYECCGDAANPSDDAEGYGDADPSNNYEQR
jgi:hypothetical protein